MPPPPSSLPSASHVFRLRSFPCVVLLDVALFYFARRSSVVARRPCYARCVNLRSPVKNLKYMRCVRAVKPVTCEQSQVRGVTRDESMMRMRPAPTGHGPERGERVERREWREVRGDECEVPRSGSHTRVSHRCLRDVRAVYGCSSYILGWSPTTHATSLSSDPLFN